MKDILVVEDDRRIALALGLRPEAHGYRLFEAADAVAAMVAALGERPDVIVLDGALPGNSGLMLVRRLLEDPRTDAVPVIVVTAGGQPALRERAVDLGAAAVLERPFTAAELLDAIDLAAGRRRREVLDGELLLAA